MTIKQGDALLIAEHVADALAVFSVTLIEDAALVGTESVGLNGNPNRLALLAVGTICLINEFAGAAMSLSQSLIGFLKGDSSQRQFQRHPGNLVREIRTGFGFVNDNDVGRWVDLHCDFQQQLLVGRSE